VHLRHWHRDSGRHGAGSPDCIAIAGPGAGRPDVGGGGSAGQGRLRVSGEIAAEVSVRTGGGTVRAGPGAREPAGPRATGRHTGRPTEFARLTRTSDGPALLTLPPPARQSRVVGQRRIRPSAAAAAAAVRSARAACEPSHGHVSSCDARAAGPFMSGPGPSTATMVPAQAAAPGTVPNLNMPGPPAPRGRRGRRAEPESLAVRPQAWRGTNGPAASQVTMHVPRGRPASRDRAGPSHESATMVTATVHRAVTICPGRRAESVRPGRAEPQAGVLTGPGPRRRPALPAGIGRAGRGRAAAREPARDRRRHHRPGSLGAAAAARGRGRPGGRAAGPGAGRRRQHEDSESLSVKVPAVTESFCVTG
jgi:hypothetical protein